MLMRRFFALDFLRRGLDAGRLLFAVWNDELENFNGVDNSL